MEELFGCTQGLEGEGETNLGRGVQKRKKRRGTEEQRGEAPIKKEFGSPGSAMRYLQPSSLPPGAAETPSLQAALGSSPGAGTEWEEEGPGMTFWLGES